MLRWRVWFRIVESGELFESMRTYKTRPQALSAGRLGVMMRRGGMFEGVAVQFKVRRRWHRRPGRGSWLP